ncbi:bifunctional 2-polyprenyl-6-hydroxyphenol methylase/3-demethylubiquinol 3-O-methyltransferase UbiG [uncultured Halovibrio sp.]|uniref:bifunctional 2-polyprenyl-6-hydroxyphenol methylase/3-demethylubiquinol 3-O-methyltransferase UbiG n=1 Tax=uncultured Halovibrio sp. TaxID=985049 RepID=UPI0025D668D3|nr:bifunctional 2-polyprenyl-6-hydroxyphenol methylase/3-demethylubiquinol 3-O-methyltransferase UbiG [uncultured Halovibrio sp.]
MTPNVDQNEIAKFDAMAQRWWDPEGECKPLHEINPLRLGYIEQHTGSLNGQTVLDVGCGGGLLSEAMARRGATVTGIDLSREAVGVADLHALEAEVTVDYRVEDVEALLEQEAGRYDTVTCLEVLEHVPDPAATVAACARLLKPGGSLVVSTINRNAKSWLFAKVGAEYVLNLLPRGTHEWKRFIRPSEMDRHFRHAGIETRETTGLTYNPVTGQYRLGRDIDVNYFMHGIKPEADA